MMYSKIISKNRPAGVSLLIAIIFVAALLLVTGSMAETHWSILQHRRDWDRYQRAKSVSESIAVLAAGDASDHKAGWNTEGSLKYVAAENKFYEGTDITPKLETDLTNPISKKIVNLMKAWYFKCQVDPSTKKFCIDFEFNYEVLGRPKDILKFGGDYYVIPVPRTKKDGMGNVVVISGTGTASSTCEHDVDGINGITQEDRNNPDNPCHWNILSIADDPHQIPFFYDDGSIKNPADMLLNKFILRVRPRCPQKRDKNNQEIPGVYKEWCTNRDSLYPTDSAIEGVVEAMNNADDDVLVHWQFTGTDRTSNDTYTLQEYQHIVDGKRKFYLDDPANNKDSAITASRINKNKAITNIVLEDNYSHRQSDTDKKYYFGKDNFNAWGEILNFLKDKSETKESKLANAKKWFDSINPDNRKIHQPYLWLEMVNRARLSGWVHGLSERAEWNYLVPSLEYQILTDRPIADSKQYIKAEITIGETTQSYVIKRPMPKLTQGFTLQ